jgi:YD repeat-containing protein
MKPRGWRITGLRSLVRGLVLLAVASPALAAQVQYTYDDVGRLREVTHDDGSKTVYALDGAGNRSAVTTTVPAGVLQFPLGNLSVNEAAGTATVTVRRVNGTFGAVSVQYTTVNQSATAPADYTATSGTLNWASGDAADKTFTVPIVNDTLVEGPETIQLVLSNPTGGAALPAGGTGGTSIIYVDIVDNDVAQPGSLALTTAAVTVPETAASVVFTVQRAGGADGAVSVAYVAAAGSGTPLFTIDTGRLEWANGETTAKTFTVFLLDNDTVYEGPETINVGLSGISGATYGAPASAVITITDDDPIPDTTAPSVPGTPTLVSASSTAVAIQWAGSTDTGGAGLAGYRIWRTSGPTTTQVGSTGSTTTSFTDTTVAGTTSYSYRVSAFDAANPVNESARSADLNLVTPDTLPPSAPTGLSATAASSSQIDLAWAASTDTGGSGLNVYRIYRGGLLLTVVGAGTTTYSDAGLSPSTTYSYYVIAFDNSGNPSGQSNTAIGTTQALPIPGTPSWTNGWDQCGVSACIGQQVYLWPLSWAAGSGGPVGYFELIRDDDFATGAIEYSGTNTSATIYLGSDRFAGFRVRACNTTGCSAPTADIYLYNMPPP